MTESTTQTDGSSERLSKDEVLGLVAMCVAIFVVANDFTAPTVAIPVIEKDFAVDLTTVQWIINGYTLVFGVLIVTGGRLADMFGQRLVFVIGAAVFGIFSTIGGLAPSVEVLLAARFCMGIGGAMMWPSVLGMTYRILPKSKAGLAGGIVIGAAGFGNAVGPLIGGALTDLASWRWLFLLNLPIAVVAIFVTLWVIPKKPASSLQEHKIDYAGIAVLSVGLLALLLALDQGTDLGWFDPRILAFFAASVIFLALFGYIEPRLGSRALVPRDVMHNRGFVAATGGTLLMASLIFATFIYLPQYMMKHLGFSAVVAGAGLLPLMGMFAATSFASGPLYNRVGAKITVTIGALALTAGVFMLTVISEAPSYGRLVPGMVMVGIGIGLFYSSITTAGITSVDESRSSLAGAIIYMAQVAGGSIGLGLTTAIVTTAPSLTDGISRAFFVNGCLAAAGAVVVLLFIGDKADMERIKQVFHRHRAHG
jgi:EmrB/QacA subfamily drug resistance transporter